VLVIHLKRFSYSGLWGEKVSTRVEYPINDLDLRSNLPLGEHPVYDLFAVSNHHGGLGGGHYTAMAKNFVNEQWFNFDDSYVSKIDVSTLQSKDTQRSAYLLFYIRRDHTNNR
jgi:ubiquitin carboxyl-terminal hydrolase 4/11/15